jgi:multidrug efflux pump subunit AcrA (membrane-fusion protein)
MQTRGSLRLEAIISEAHIQKVYPGTRLKGTIGALSLSFETTVEELVPAGDPSTRTFLVKTSLPSDERIFPGMFGRLMVPLDEIAVVTVPVQAVTKVGQLETVLARTDGNWKRVLVKTGRIWADRVEILSGLTGSETVALDGEGRDVR